MRMKLIITKDDGTPIHEVVSDIMNGIFEVTFDQEFVPKDEKGRLTKIELGFHFVHADDIISGELTAADSLDPEELRDYTGEEHKWTQEELDMEDDQRELEKE